jgi:hypothetical protein
MIFELGHGKNGEKMHVIHQSLKICLAAALLLTAALWSPDAAADEFADASAALCEKMKTCAAAQMGDIDNMSDAMKAQIMTSLEGMCIGIDQSYSAFRTYNDLYVPATACMKSMSELSCAELEAGEKDATPQCAAFREAAKKYE